MRLIAGIVIGLVLGTAASALAVGTYYNNRTFLDLEYSKQMSYMAGVSDAIDTIADDSSTTTAAARRIAACLDSRAQNLGPLTDWAIEMAKNNLSNGNSYQMASTIFARACN